MNDLDIREVKFQYPDGQQALRGLTLGVAHSERVALVGANGSGKSTLLLHLNGILRAASGSVTINGVPLTDQSIPQIRAWVGLVFQNPDDQLFSPRVYDDVAFAPRYRGLPENEVRDRVQHALGLVSMEAYADRISHHLSIGEKKRIALATVLTMDTRLLVLDEPSAGLDPRARRSLITLLQSFTKQTLLISTHDMRLAAELCTRAVVLDAGQVVADGAVESVLYARELMERHGLETP
ncbi:MAG: ABC transporter ATP-binding protein [Chloroflexi bacterium]|nr:ABC transporter ATP-binding protein [Chloroflexota bacterium]